MKSLSKLVLIFVFSTFSILSVAQADVKNDKSVFLDYCSHSGPGVSYFFQSCVNYNFSAIGREVGGFFDHCTNFGNEVDYFFTSCVNSGFREAERKLGNTVFLPFCYNFDREALDFSYVSCVNSNFRSIERELNRRP